MPSNKPTATTRLSPEEHKEIVQGAARARLSVSAYLRRICLGMPTPSFEKAEAVRDLVRINGDLGRLGGLLKMWLTNEDKYQGDVERLLAEIRQTKALLLKKIEEL